MQTIHWSCDGCGRKLKGDSLASALKLSNDYDRKDIYCPERCQRYAIEFWEVSTPVFAKIFQDSTAAISNYRRKFFASKTVMLKEVV